MNSQTYPPVVIVDENDNEIGTAMLADAWQQGLYHRIVSVFVEDEYGRMLLQLRSPTVKVFPSCWDQAAGGHVDAGHSYEQTAVLETKEELGLDNVQLKVLGTHRSNFREGDRIINQFERVYVVQIPHGTQLRPQADEVSSLKWFERAELNKQATVHPDTCTPGLLYCLKKYFPAFGQ